MGQFGPVFRVAQQLRVGVAVEIDKTGGDRQAGSINNSHRRSAFQPAQGSNFSAFYTDISAKRGAAGPINNRAAPDKQ